MRPIHLSVSGLHSFREKQEVDFQSLCEGGVFGIFGPTGSGKSSILDALTLALYGKVERAANNIQGIMNHAENEIHVSFTFELGNAEHTSRYRVERSFKRTNELTLRTSLCRLLEISDETHVLADKNNEVNIKVQDLLGLTIDDFTRAVVLPQGKFAEFLSLKGTDRRQMLQRLFHLEQYGDQLMDKLRHRTTKARGQLDTIVAEQQGLGDASEETMQEVDKRLEQAEQSLLQVERQRKEIEATFDTNQKIWQWQDERSNVEKQLTQLEGQKEQIVSLENRLVKAQGAQQLKPYVEECLESNLEVNHWSVKNEANTQTLIGIRAQEQEHTLLYQKAVK
ncbi:MAG: AAA family ATPase, partial [Bacilli bacterium]